jgi:hypothetical protein
MRGGIGIPWFRTPQIFFPKWVQMSIYISNFRCRMVGMRLLVGVSYPAAGNRGVICKTETEFLHVGDFD